MSRVAIGLSKQMYGPTSLTWQIVWVYTLNAGRGPSSKIHIWNEAFVYLVVPEKYFGSNMAIRIWKHTQPQNHMKWCLCVYPGQSMPANDFICFIYSQSSGMLTRHSFQHLPTLLFSYSLHYTIMKWKKKTFHIQEFNPVLSVSSHPALSTAALECAHNDYLMLGADLKRRDNQADELIGPSRPPPEAAWGPCCCPPRLRLPACLLGCNLQQLQAICGFLGLSLFFLSLFLCPPHSFSLPLFNLCLC